MLNNRSELRWMRSHRQIRPWQNASPTEDMLSTSQNDMNMQLQEQTGKKKKKKELNRTGRLISKLLFFVSQIKWGPCLFDSPSVTFLNKTKLYILYLFFFVCLFLNIEFTIPKTKIKTLKTTPVHLLHTIGSQKYFGHFCVSTNSSISL